MPMMISLAGMTLIFAQEDIFFIAGVFVNDDDRYEK
jgi:hypothetical protein